MDTLGSFLTLRLFIRSAGLTNCFSLSFSFLDLLPIFPLGGGDPVPDIGGSLVVFKLVSSLFAVEFLWSLESLLSLFF